MNPHDPPDGPAPPGPITGKPSRAPDKLLVVFVSLYFYPVVYTLVSGIPLASCVIICVAYLAYMVNSRGESFRTALRRLELAAPLIILWVLGVDWIESSAWPPPHVVFTDPETGHIATCGTGAYLARMGYGELWTGFLWLIGVTAKKLRTIQLSVAQAMNPYNP